MTSTINRVDPFLMGILFGFCLTLIIKIGSLKEPSRDFYQYENTSLAPITIVNETIDRKSSPKPLPQESTTPPDTEITELKINSTIASKLEKEVRIVCWIMTRPADVTEKLAAIKTTWGKRCTKLLILSSANNNQTGTMGLNNTEEGRDWLWAKTKEAFKYIYANHLDDGEWFMKADDDTYMIMENLRYLLYGRDPMKATYFGCWFKDPGGNNQSQGYMSGGAGYILSKESVIRFVEISVKNPDLCHQDHTGSEDFEMGKCLEKVGVLAVDSRDTSEHRFLPFDPDEHVYMKRDDSYWYWTYSMFPQNLGMECCSNFAISFHYVSPQGMYQLEYFLYHLKPFGISVLYNFPLGKKGKLGQSK